MSDLIVRRKSRIMLLPLALAMALLLAPSVAPAFEPTQVYEPIGETMAEKTVALTGHDLTIELVIDIARHGAKAALISTNAYAQAQAVLLIADARRLLEWTDLSQAMNLLGMNSSVTSISAPVQAMRCSLTNG